RADAGETIFYDIYTEEEKKSVLKKIVKEVFDDSDAKTVEAFSDCISEIKNKAPAVLDGEIKDVSQDDYLSAQFYKLSNATQCSSESELARVINEYTSKMTQNNAMDFDDLLYYVHKLFSKFPEILDKYREIYKYILIDEFQDTNKVQYEIFRMLGEKHRNIFVVGDDDQSIYSWRGAESYNLKKFQADFSDCSVYKLEQNYRSTKRILDVANIIISKNGNRFDKVLWTDNEEGVKTQLFSAYNEQDEAYFVTEQIKNIMYMNPRYRYKDFAVLMRVNALSRSFEHLFRQNRMPYKVFGGFKFFERREIKDVLAYMHLVHNRYDEEAFIRALNAPVRRGIGDGTIAKLRDLSAEYALPLLDVISDERNLDTVSSSIRGKLSEFYKLIDGFYRTANLPLQAFVRNLISTLRFREIYSENEEDDRVMNIDAFESEVAEFQAANPSATLQDFLETVSLDNEGDADNTDSDYITIATIHAVKGLEYKVVFVVGLEEGIFPTSRATYESEGLQEERRLMYVAVTRAEKRLYLTKTNSRYLWGQAQRNMPSKYYVEVQKFLSPPRPAVSERQLSDDRFLDKLIERDFSDKAPNQGKSAGEISKYKVGQKVKHSSFGVGMILSIKGDVAEIVFENVGKKSLNLKFAPLETV
ncbi:MAG: UvrD-helicase domain-containing protein, partial [Firmicutes bacterium]|nr:UvrD-helicase domain-containing protein [Bacillota bacterium]